MFTFTVTTDDPTLAAQIIGILGPVPTTVAASAPVPAQVSDTTRLSRALTNPPLPLAQKLLLQLWFEAEDWVTAKQEQARFVSEGLSADPASAVSKVRAALAVLSARIGRAFGRPQRPLTVLVEIRYDDRGSASHRLTELGREAVELVLEHG